MRFIAALSFIVFLFSACEDKQIDRNWNRLEGKWNVIDGWFRQDNKQVFRNNNSRDNWTIEFRADSTFTLITDNDTFTGNYHSRLTQIEFEFSEPKEEKPRLWYFVHISRNRIEATEMTSSGEFEYLWKREK